jgi:ubiquinone/menaquinone biosynthesis C-methylase UbiE
MNMNAINQENLQALLGRALVDLGAVSAAALVGIGDRLNLYKVLATHGPLTSEELAERTGTAERYVREWLNANAASGYVDYLADSARYTMSPEQIMVFADDHSPCFLVGGFDVAMAAVKIAPRLERAFQTGEGIAWHEHHHQLFHGIERFFRTGYAAHLVQDWIPQLDGVQEKLQRGALVADVGCGLGASTILMAQAFPESRFHGFDFHPESIAAARARAIAAGVQNRVSFEVAGATDFPARGYDLVTMFDALHDMGAPQAAAEQVLRALAADGSWMIVEPAAGDRVEDNLNPVGRAYYAGSTLMCTPCAIAQGARTVLGAQAGPARISGIVREAGFSRVRVAASTPFNLIFEARR